MPEQELTTKSNIDGLFSQLREHTSLLLGSEQPEDDDDWQSEEWNEAFCDVVELACKEAIRKLLIQAKKQAKV